MKKLIPFRMSGRGWGKEGRELAIAEATYNLAPDSDELRDTIVTINNKFDKEEATARKDPWVNVIKMGMDPDNVVQGYFELDWNDEFVQYLQEKGMQGSSDEDVVNKWFNAVCRTVLVQEQADLDYGMQGANEQFRTGGSDVIFTRDSKDGDSGTKSKK
jgi:hypothetical protein|tara:strand:- start:4126 stop:4602 length:477 start_codon:yes stop_codon:yes gene_type:complete